MKARRQWLTYVILATQEAEIRIVVQSQPRQIVYQTLSKKKKTKRRTEWLKVKALSSSPSTKRKRLQ
jgi:hypothetical protein